jgi:cysteine desulfurase
MSGGHQENGMRPGTHNVPGIVGLGKAAELAEEHLLRGAGELSEIKRRLESGILASCRGARVIGEKAPRLGNTTSVLFRGVESEAVLTLLDMEGICASSGSACSTGESDPSHVLLAMGIDPREANSAIRFSLSRYTTEEEVELLLEVLPEIISKLRSISPYAD